MLKRLFYWLLSFFQSYTIHIDGKPYLTRYYLTGAEPTPSGTPEEKRVWGVAVFLHHFHASDGERALHNHPWPGLSLILRGGYVEERCSEYLVPVNEIEETGVYTRAYDANGTYVEADSGFVPKVHRVKHTPVTIRTLKPGMLNRIGLNDYHRAELIDEVGGAWTLFFTSERVKSWGFLDPETGVFTPHLRAGKELT